MSAPLLVACLWVLAGTATAFLPMRYQFVPGLTLLLTAPILIAWIGYEHGFWLALAGGFAFVSMFRRPLWHFGKKALGR